MRIIGNSLPFGGEASSIAFLPRHSPRRDKAGMRQPRDDLLWDRFGLYATGIGGVTNSPDPGLEALHRERHAMGQAVLDLEARAAAADHGGLDRDLVAEPGRQQKSRPGLDQRMTGKFVSLEIFDLLHAQRPLEQYDGGDIEHFEIAGKENDPGRVAVAPFDPGFAGAGEHGLGVRYQISGSRTRAWQKSSFRR